MPLTDEQRERARRRLMALNEQDFNLTRPQLRNAVLQAEAWIEANQASYLAAVTEPLTNQQKARLFMAVAEVRF